MPSPYWFEDPTVLLDPAQFYKVLPMSGDTYAEKLNAVVRFFLYLGVFLAVALRRAVFLFFPIVAMGVSIALARFYTERKEALDAYLHENDVAIDPYGEACLVPTLENPFMNPSVVDFKERADRPRACDVTDPGVQDQIEIEFNKRFAKDFDDVYGRNGGSRQFYTVPSTLVPSDQTSFAEWLYGTGKTCKEGNGDACEALNYRYVANK